MVREGINWPLWVFIGFVALIGLLAYRRSPERDSAEEMTDRSEEIASESKKTPQPREPRKVREEVGASRDVEIRVRTPEAPAWVKVSKEQIEAAERLGLPAAKELDLGGGLKMKLVLIPAGEFIMGSPTGEERREDDEGPQHQVKITKPFYLGACEVTVGEFRRFVFDAKYETTAEGGVGAVAWTGSGWEKRKDLNWSNPGFAQYGSHPVACVSWSDAREFCEWLSREAAVAARLPTEAEWEYACRAGSTTAFCCGDDPRKIGQYGWYWGNSEAKNHPVGQKRPNAYGLYDMHGNAWEWCQDWYDSNYYKKSQPEDPQGPPAGTARVLRGGSWLSWPWYCRSATRAGSLPQVTSNLNGFRVVVGP